MQTPQELLDAMPASLAYTRCATVAEYLSAHAPPGSPLALRMSEARLTSDAQSVMVGCSDPLNLLALVAPNLPDAPGVIPLWVRMAQCCPRAELRFAGEADAFLVERLLGEEAASILDAIELPWLLVFNEEWQLVAQWGPRPQSAEAMIDEWLAQHPDFEALAEAAADGADSAQEGAPAEASPTSDAAGEQLAALLRNLMLHTRLWYNSGLDADCSAELQQLLAGLHDESESPEDVQDGT
jgi:hypothetical protein